MTFFKNIESSPLKATPISASLASPGPFTGQPIIAIVISFLIPLTFSSTSFTIFIKSTLVLAQVGHETIFTPNFLNFKLFNISFPTFTSSKGSPVIETLIVSPIP